jgi:sensor histidine kinase regulating citrate/malate metabolism
VWWGEVERRFAGPALTLNAAIEDDANIPAGVFDSFVENALDNTAAKAEREPALRVALAFACSVKTIEVSVTDDGSAIPEAIARKLFASPVERSMGLGIGLFNAARLAGQAGFHLALAVNRDGEVRFTLSREAPARADR